uniref:Uncharacterized protein n=1 Tax=Acrobeloides nanus TaxID=290746 RepID=A0A914C978_9BILA
MDYKNQIFRKDSLQWCYRYDRVDPQKWNLIYRDINASRMYIFIQCGFLYMVYTMAIAIFDYVNNGKITLKSVQKKKDEFEELGYFGYAILAFFGLMTMVIWNYNRMLIFRIYQSVSSPSNFRIIVPSRIGLCVVPTKIHYGIVKHSIHWNHIEPQRHFHEQIHAADTNMEFARKFARNIIFGNICLGTNKTRYTLGSDELFTNNIHARYFLKELDKFPKKFQEEMETKRERKNLHNNDK